MANSKKVFLTTLSVTSKQNMRVPNKNTYFYGAGDNKRYCTGIQQQEPGAKYILSKYDIDKIVVLASEETISSEEANAFYSLQKGNGEVCLRAYYDTLPSRDEISAKERPTFAFFCHRIAEFVFGEMPDNQPGKNMMTPNEALKKKDISVVLIVYKDNGNDHFLRLTEALTGTEQEKTELYMDAQGGARTALYVNNALLQMLSQLKDVYHFELKRVVATDFLGSEHQEHPIKDETAQYKIIDLVSGMNAFLKYGKADSLIAYFRKTENKTVKALCRAMKGIDEAIMLSKFEETEEDDRRKNDPHKPRQDTLLAAIKKFRSAVERLEQEVNDNKDNGIAIFRILLKGIKDAYGDLLKEKLDYLSVIKWCMKIGDIGDALRVLEAHLPEIIAQKGILYYAKNEEEKGKAKTFFQEEVRNAEQKFIYRFEDVNHYYINQYFRYAIAQKNSSNDKTQVFPLADKDSFREITCSYYYYEIGQANWEVPLYTTIKDTFAVAKILSVYYWLCDIRNGISHTNNKREATFHEIKENIEWLLREIESSHGGAEDYCLPGNVLKEEIKKRREMKNKRYTDY